MGQCTIPRTSLLADRIGLGARGRAGGCEVAARAGDLVTASWRKSIARDIASGARVELFQEWPGYVTVIEWGCGSSSRSAFAISASAAVPTRARCRLPADRDGHASGRPEGHRLPVDGRKSGRK